MKFREILFSPSLPMLRHFRRPSSILNILYIKLSLLIFEERSDAAKIDVVRRQRTSFVTHKKKKKNYSREHTQSVFNFNVVVTCRSSPHNTFMKICNALSPQPVTSSKNRTHLSFFYLREIYQLYYSMRTC